MGALLGMVLGTGLLLVWLAVSELQGCERRRMQFGSVTGLIEQPAVDAVPANLAPTAASGVGVSGW